MTIRRHRRAPIGKMDVPPDILRARKQRPTTGRDERNGGNVRR